MNIDLNDLPEEITMDVVLNSTDWGFVRMYSPDEAAIVDGIVISAKPVTVTFKVIGKAEATTEIVKELKEKSQKIKAIAEVKCNEIDEKINSLLALTCDD